MSFVITIRVVATLCGSVAICTTALRLYYRWSRGHLGYDDAWAGFSLFCVSFLIAGAWIRSDPSLSNEQRVIGYYMLQSAFTCVLWSARMSILFSIMRIIPYLMLLRRYSYGGAALFAAMWIVMIVQKVYVCETHSAWKSNPKAQCVLGKSVGIVELCTDVTADIILIILPVRLLWDISISPSRRKLLITIFSASIITTVVSIVHTSYELGPDRNAEGIAAHVEANTSLIICNLSVLVTWLVRVIQHGEDLESGPSDNSKKRRKTDCSTQLTTLRFGHDPPIVLTATAMEEAEADDNKPIELANVKQDRRLSVPAPPDVSRVSFSDDVEYRDAKVKMRDDSHDSYGE